MASSLRSCHFSATAKNATIAGALKRARVSGSARSGSLRRSRPRSGTAVKAFIAMTPLMEIIISYFGVYASQQNALFCYRYASQRRALESRNGRAAGKFLHERVADVAEIFDADLAGEETVGGELAQETEEFDALAGAGIGLRVLAIGDLVENFLLLCRRALEVRAAVAIDAGIIQPHQSAAQGNLIFFVLAADEVDKFRRPGFNRALRIGVGRNNGLAERLQRFVRVGGEIFGRVGLVFGGGLLRAYHFVHVFSGFAGNHARDRARNGCEREGFQNVSA